MFGSKILVERKNWLCLATKFGVERKNWLCLAAKFGVERKKGEGALEREKKEREREHLRDKETNGFWEFQI